MKKIARMNSKKKKILSLLMVLCLVLTGCSSANKKDEGDDEIAKDQYEIMVMNQYGEVVSDANISLNGVSASTGSYGTAKFDKPEAGNYALKVTCRDYYDYSDSSFAITEESSASTITIKAKSLQVHRLKSAVYRCGLTEVDLIDTYKKINQGVSALDFSIGVTVCGDVNTVSRYELYQQTQSTQQLMAKSTNGTFSGLNVKDFAVGTGIFVTVYDKSGHETSTSLRLEIAENPNLTQCSTLSLGDGISFEVGDDIPIFGGATLNMEFPKLPLDYKFSEEMVHIGINVDEDTFNDDAQFEEYKKMINEMKAVKFQATNLKKAVAQLQKKQKKKGIMSMAGFDKGVDVVVGGYLEAGFNPDGSLSQGSGYMTVTITASAEFDWQVVVWVIPVVIGIEGQIEGNLSAGITYDFNANQLKGDVSLKISPSLQAKAGVGFKYLNGGVYGSAGLETNLIIADPEKRSGFEYLDLTSSIGIYAKVAWFEPEKDLLKGTFHLYTREEMEEKSATKTKGNVLEGYHEIYNLANYVPVLKGDAADTTIREYEDKARIAYNVNKGSLPVTASNGTQGMSVYQVQEQLGESSYVYNKLYYSLYDGENWSDGEIVDDTERNEMNQKLYVDGDDFYMVYQESSMDMSELTDYEEKSEEERLSILERVWKSIDLHVKKYNMTEGQWTDYGIIDTPDIFDYNGDLVVDDGKIYVYSGANAQGDYFGTNPDTVNYINASVYEDGTWKTTKLVDDLSSVTALAAGVYDGIPTCLYVTDTDNDLMTLQDGKVYLVQDGDADAREIYAGSVLDMDYLSGGESEEKFVFSEGNSLYEVKEDGTTEVLLSETGSYDGVYAVTENGIYYVKNEKNGTELYTARKLEDGTYGKGVPVTQEGMWHKNLSAFTANGKDVVVTLSGAYEEEDLTDMQINAYTVGGYCDVVLKDMDYAMTDTLAGEEMTVNAIVANYGTEKISHLVFSAEDASGNEMILKETEVSQEILPGEEVQIPLTLTGLSNASFGEWTFSARAKKSVEEDASDEISTENTQDNNFISVSMGFSDFAISAKMLDSGEYPYMMVEVTNKGNMTDSATLTLYNANDLSQVYRTKEIGELAPGSTKLYKLNVDKSKADKNGKIALLCKVEDASKELYTHNNYVYQYTTTNYGTFKISYRLNGGTNSSKNPSTYTTADTVKLSNPSRTGYTFAGWYTSSDYNVKTRITEIAAGNAQDMLLYAKWKKNGSSITRYPVGTKLKSSKKVNAVIKVTKKGTLSNGVVKGAKATYMKPIKAAKTITIPNTVKIKGVTYKITGVAKNALKKNKKVKKLVIGKNVKSIGKSAFYGCKKLKKLVIMTKSLTAKKVGANAFSKIGSKVSVKIKNKKYKSLLRKRGLSKKAKIKVG